MKRHFVIIIILLCGILLLPTNVQAGDELPKKAYIEGVKAHPQNHSLSCESRSAVDWAAYFGVEISEKKFLKNLPRSKNPEEGFVGQPDGQLGNIPPRSYGVHAGPVAALLTEYGLPAVAQHGIEWDQLRAEIAAERPVIVWVIGQMWAGEPVEYTTTDGAATVVAAYEHTMILVGYSPSTVIAIDATTGDESVYPLQKFISSWEVLGRMAITARAPTNSQINEDIITAEENKASDSLELPAMPLEPTATNPQSPSGEGGSEKIKIYTVRRGEYLTGIAKKLGVNWRSLARANKLTPPFILYTGQKLRIP